MYAYIHTCTVTREAQNRGQNMPQKERVASCRDSWRKREVEIW